MSTPAVLAVFFGPNTVHVTTVHWDGDRAGDTLKRYYNTPEKAKALSDLGDLSTLGVRLAPEPEEPHTFDRPAPGVCVAYHRDRGEDMNIEVLDGIKVSSDLDNALRSYGSDYWYVFIQGRWFRRVFMRGCRGRNVRGEYIPL